MMIPPRIRIGATFNVRPLEQVGERVMDLRPYWIEGLQPMVTAALTQRFDTGGAAFGGPKWAPLAPVTTLMRQQSGRGRGGILRDSGRLWASLTKSVGATAAPEGVLNIEPTRYERGTTVPYAQFQQWGFRSVKAPVQRKDAQGNLRWTFVPRQGGPKWVPARPPIPPSVPPDFLDQVKAGISAWVANGSL